MKIPKKFTIYDLRFTIENKSSGVVVGRRADVAGNHQSSIINRKSASGIALVITLIMLSVTLIMAVAFLALSRRDRSAVATTTDTAVARLAADSALAAAQAQMVANIFATGASAYDYHLLVSTNYLPPTVGLPGDLTNLFILPRAPVYVVNPNNGLTDYRFYLDVNRNGIDEANGPQPQLDSAGLFIHTDGTADSAIPINVLTNFMTGDPEWIGVLERPDQPHSANNHFVARYAFFAQPVGNGLDLNYIHNQTRNPSSPMNPALDGYFRNEGVGSWELNLAAFLADLNTNQWNTNASPYNYAQWNGGLNSGNAFYDAFGLLNYRYANQYNTLAVPPLYFYNALVGDGIDGYTLGNLMTTNVLPAVATPLNGPNAPWVGSDNINRFFSLPSDLFDVSKSSVYFTTHLALATSGNGSATPSTYDRYTLYRLLDQLGTDSTADGGKMNLNFRNVTNGAVVAGMETNLLAWTPLEFFTNAADRMLKLYSSNWFAAGPSNYLRTYYGLNYTDGYVDRHTGYGFTNAMLGTNVVPAFGIANIPVQVNGSFVYSPAVNRVLQLAANLYDASTNAFYPSVFRPRFTRDTLGNLYITGYTNIDTITTGSELSTPLDATQVLLPTANNVFINIYGVPWIIGAKKNFPGLNQFAMINSAQFQRNLEVTRNVATGTVLSTNQKCQLKVDNNLGISFWNSYSNDYVGSGNLVVQVNHTVQMALTNSDWGTPYNFAFTNNFTFITNRWPGSQWGSRYVTAPAANAFIAFNWSNNLVPWSAYDFVQKKFFPTNAPNVWDRTLSPLPQLGLQATNLMQAYILDGSAGNYHVIDYVQLRGPMGSANLNSALQDPNDGSAPNGGAPNYYLWLTNNWAGRGPSWGIKDQLDVSSMPIAPANLPGSAQWNNPSGLPAGLDPKAGARALFRAVLSGVTNFAYNGVLYPLTEGTNQAGYTANRTIFAAYLYQVNDPLVHYLASDLDAGRAAIFGGLSGSAIANGKWYQDNGAISQKFPAIPNVGNPGILKGQSRFQPWGQIASTTYNANDYNFGAAAYNLLYKDPLTTSPDAWDFPTNKFPTAGWLGRVHRGTPWQTVYLKPRDVLKENLNNPTVNASRGINTWSAWTGDQNYFDAANSAPLQDRLLFDLFTTRFNDNAAHGTLSVNQTNLAAWSALFSGMVALTNTTVFGGIFIPKPSYSWLNIQPAGVGGLSSASALGNLVANINSARSSYTNDDGLVGVFEHVGDILSAPALTEQSPFLNWNNTSQQNYGISDEVYEWLPQQALGLLRVSSSPRYVVYCYGQSLRPAKDSVITSSGNGLFGLVTNYQVMAESAARAVIRLDAKVVNDVTNYSATVESYNLLPPD